MQLRYAKPKAYSAATKVMTIMLRLHSNCDYTDYLSPLGDRLENTHVLIKHDHNKFAISFINDDIKWKFSRVFSKFRIYQVIAKVKQLKFI